MFSEIENYNAAQLHHLNEFMTQVIAGKAVSPGDVVLDLGANTGFHTRFFSGLVGESGLVHAFEPNPDLWPVLWGMVNVRLWPVAVGDVTSVEKFILPVDFDQVGSIVDPRDFMGDVATRILSVPQVPVDALDEVVRSKITFAKIDIERREAAALRGMQSLLQRDGPILVYENHTQEIEAILAALGYRKFDFFSAVGITSKLANVVALPIAKADIINDILPTAEEIEKCVSNVAMAAL